MYLSTKGAHVVTQDLVPCRKCGRSFNSDRVARHQKSCVVNKPPPKKKSSQYRGGIGVSAGSKNGRVQNAGRTRKGEAGIAKKPSNWRAKHAEFQKAIQAGKQLQKALKEG